MKNKNLYDSLDETPPKVITLICILIAIIGILLLLYFWDDLIPEERETSDSDYTIYQEECHNISNWELINKTNFKTTPIVSSGDRLDCYANFDRSLYCDIYHKIELKVCNQVKVSEMPQKCFDQYWNKIYCDQMPNRIIEVYRTGDTRVMMSNFTYYYQEMISKEHLNEYFLNDECAIRRCTTCEDLDCKNQKCDAWYCGNYQVIKNE